MPASSFYRGRQVGRRRSKEGLCLPSSGSQACCAKRYRIIAVIIPERGAPVTKRAYLAGPEVFLADARHIGARKRAICTRHGLVGVFPADEEDVGGPALPPRERGLAISRTMERVMWGCDAMIVNLTPFRGPSADVGSAYEMGFMRALGRPIFAYSHDARPFLDRVHRRPSYGGAVRLRLNVGEHEDPDAHGGSSRSHLARQPHAPPVAVGFASGGCLLVEAESHTERYTSLAAFERCVIHAAVELLR